MTVKVGINGMGRIGRMVIRAIIESQNKNIEIKHINNRSNPETSCALIKYDSIHGKFNAELDFDEKHLIINKNKITFSQESNIKDINWKSFDVDYVFECTGKFNSKEKLLAHIKNGAKKVIVSAPCKNADKTIVFGVNENILTNEDQIISAASCTTNCLAPVANVLNEDFEIEKGFMTTIHAFTSDQRILDNSHKDPRRARSASQSIVPTSTGASKAIGEIIPSLKGKLEGVAMRVPIPNVSLIELVFCTKKEINKDGKLSDYEETRGAAIEKNLDNENINEAARVPSNILDFAKRKGSYATSLVKKAATWAEKAGKYISGGTAIGKDYMTIILDMKYQGSEIYINLNNETIELFGEKVTDAKSFQKVLDTNIEENVAPNHDGKSSPFGSGFEKYKPLEKKITKKLKELFVNLKKKKA